MCYNLGFDIDALADDYIKRKRFRYSNDCFGNKLHKKYHFLSDYA